MEQLEQEEYPMRKTEQSGSIQDVQQWIVVNIIGG
jgi:hypothetical protein